MRSAKQNWYVKKITKCLRCNGRGKYYSVTRKEEIVCPVCNGTKREPR